MVLRTPDPGRVQHREHRPLRVEPAPLRALHLAHPPLRRSDRAPRADPRAAARRRTGSRCRDRAAAGHRAARSPTPSAAPWRQSARPPTGSSPRISPIASAPTFGARIAGVTRSGLFVRLKDTGADGFVPVSSLQGDFYHHVEAQHALVGKRTGETFRLGEPVEVRLVEAIPSAGALTFRDAERGQGPRCCNASCRRRARRHAQALRRDRPRPLRIDGARAQHEIDARASQLSHRSDSRCSPPARSPQAMRRGGADRCPACGKASSTALPQGRGRVSRVRRGVAPSPRR